MYTINEEDYLAHFGVLGMRWGHRKARETGSTANRSRREQRKVEKAQKKWDRNASGLNTKVWNKAAEKFNNGAALQKLNSKYFKKYGKNSNDWDESTLEKYQQEYDKEWGKAYTDQFIEMYGDRPV